MPRTTVPSTKAPRQADATVPADYGEVFSKHMAMIQRMIGNLGIVQTEREDVSSELLTKFIEKDGLAKYDPQRVHHTALKTGAVVATTASFATMLRGFVMVYVRHQRDRQNSRLSREIVRLDAPVDESEVELITALFRQEDHADQVIAATDAGRILVMCRRHLSSLLWSAGRPLSDVFDAMALVHTQYDRIVAKQVAEILGVSVHHASLGIRKVRAALVEFV